MSTHIEPTYENQLWQARKIVAEQGAEELRRHALVGMQCHCGDCFCCAAQQVYEELKTPLRAGIIPVIVGATKDILLEKAVHYDGFRLWFYPQMPDDYSINVEVDVAALEGAGRGLSAQKIADGLFAKHS